MRYVFYSDRLSLSEWDMRKMRVKGKWKRVRKRCAQCVDCGEDIEMQERKKWCVDRE